MIKQQSNGKAKSVLFEALAIALGAWTATEMVVGRTYTIYGRAELGSSEGWHSPTNSLDRFFKVGVEMRERAD